MRAAWRERYGTGEVLQIRELDTPEPNEDEILIRVHSTTLNRTDCANLTAKPWIMRLMQGLTRPRQPIPGTDFAGTVERIGQNIAGVSPGDALWGFYDLGLSSQAEYMILRKGVPYGHVPEAIPLEHAAACLEGVHYAINFLNKVNLKPGQSAIVNGGTGAIGSAMIQLLRIQDIEVTATCRAVHFEAVRKLGATNVIDYENTDFTHSDLRVDYVFDAVGKSTFGKCRKILKPGGVYISSELGPFVQNPFLALLTPLFHGRKVKFPIPVDMPETLRYVHELVTRKEFYPLIDRVYSLEKISDGYDYVLTGEKAGNVLLYPHNPGVTKSVDQK